MSEPSAKLRLLELIDGEQGGEVVSNARKHSALLALEAAEEAVKAQESVTELQRVMRRKAAAAIRAIREELAR